MMIIIIAGMDVGGAGIFLQMIPLRRRIDVEEMEKIPVERKLES